MKKKRAPVFFKKVSGVVPGVWRLFCKVEDYLYDTAKKIKDCGLPYGYVSIGSAMAFSVDAYISIGGMNTRKATEDFYFLQEIAKTKHVNTIDDEIVELMRASNCFMVGLGIETGD